MKRTEKKVLYISLSVLLALTYFSCASAPPRFDKFKGPVKVQVEGAVAEGKLMLLNDGTVDSTYFGSSTINYESTNFAEPGKHTFQFAFSGASANTYDISITVTVFENGLSAKKMTFSRKNTNNSISDNTTYPYRFEISQ